MVVPGAESTEMALVRSAYNRPFFGDRLYEAFLAVKNLFDPENLMNPGKIV